MAVVHEDGGAPIIPVSVEDARSKFFDVIKRFTCPPRTSGLGSTPRGRCATSDGAQDLHREGQGLGQIQARRGHHRVSEEDTTTSKVGLNWVDDDLFIGSDDRGALHRLRLWHPKTTALLLFLLQGSATAGHRTDERLAHLSRRLFWYGRRGHPIEEEAEAELPQGRGVGEASQVWPPEAFHRDPHAIPCGWPGHRGRIREGGGHR